MYTLNYTPYSVIKYIQDETNVHTGPLLFSLSTILPMTGTHVPFKRKYFSPFVLEQTHFSNTPLTENEVCPRKLYVYSICFINRKPLLSVQTMFYDCDLHDSINRHRVWNGVLLWQWLRKNGVWRNNILFEKRAVTVCTTWKQFLQNSVLYVTNEMSKNKIKFD